MIKVSYALFLLYKSQLYWSIYNFHIFLRGEGVKYQNIFKAMSAASLYIFTVILQIFCCLFL